MGQVIGFLEFDTTYDFARGNKTLRSKKFILYIFDITYLLFIRGGNMSYNTDIIKNIIASGAPDASLSAKAQESFSAAAISTQVAREKNFIKSIQIVDPITHKRITNIQELNALIEHLDEIYNLSALLPSGSFNTGGEVERILSRKYNLNLRATNKFTAEEQQRLQMIMQNLANYAVQKLESDPTFKENILSGAMDRAWLQILAMMGKLRFRIPGEPIQLFLSPGLSSTGLASSIYGNIFEDNDGVPVLYIRYLFSNIIGKKTGSGKTMVKQRSGFSLNINGQGKVEVEFNPDFNKLSPAAFNELYTYAENEGLLTRNLELESNNKLGEGKTPPLTVSPEEWKQDVYNAVHEALEKNGLMLGIKSGNTSLLDELMSKYHVESEIALGRSIANLRGFLGELRGILMIHLLFPNADNTLLGTAKVTLENSTGSQDAPLDLMADIMNQAFGIQVKNTSDLESYAWGNYRESKGMTVPGFYAERLQSSISDSEANFFGAYVYNQPISDASQEYRDIYGGFQSTFKSKFVPVYQKMALYIIRQSTTISKSSNPILSGTIRNDFFMMNNKFIPASAFLRAVGGQANFQNLINSSFELTEAVNSFYTPQDAIPDNYMSYTSMATIKYKIEVQFAQLLQSAYSLS